MNFITITSKSLPRRFLAKIIFNKSTYMISQTFLKDQIKSLRMRHMIFMKISNNDMFTDVPFLRT